VLDDLGAQASPTLRDAYGVGADSAAELLIVFGDNPERIRSEAASWETLRHVSHTGFVRTDQPGTASTEADTAKPTQRSTH